MLAKCASCELRPWCRCRLRAEGEGRGLRGLENSKLLVKRLELQADVVSLGGTLL